MSSVLDSLASAFGPDVVSGLSKTLGVDASAVSKGLGAVGPLALAGMARMASAPGGADSLMKMLPQDAGGLLGNLGSLLGGLFGGGGAAPTSASALLGPGVNAIGASLSRALGFNVTPLLSMAIPAALSAVSKLVQEQKLDGAGLTALLTKERDAVAADPARKEATSLATAAMQAGSAAEETISAYGPDWAKVSGGPVAALFMVATSDLSGPLGSIKEAQAAGKAMLDAANRAPPTSVLVAACGGGLTPEMAKGVKELAPSKDKLIDVIKAGAAAVAVKSPSDAQAYKDMILAVAQATAAASKEGGFLGIGGTLVSEDEQAAIDTIKAALA